MTKRKQFLKAFDARLCQLCGEPVPEGDGLVHASVRLFVHSRKCGERLMAAYKTYDKSERGRMRNRDEIWRELGLEARAFEGRRAVSK